MTARGVILDPILQPVIDLLHLFLSPEEMGHLKTNLITAVVAAFYIEWRTKKRFAVLESVGQSLTISLQTLRDNFEHLFTTVARVEKADQESTLLFNNKFQEKTEVLSRFEKFLQALDERVILIEDKIKSLRGSDNNKEQTL